MRKTQVILFILLPGVVLLMAPACGAQEKEERDLTTEGALEEQVEKDIQLTLTRFDALPESEVNEPRRAFVRLEKYIDDLDAAIEKGGEEQKYLMAKRDKLVEKLGNILKNNAEMVEAQWKPKEFEDAVRKYFPEFLIEVRRDQQTLFSITTNLLSRINDQKAVDLLIAHIDRRWYYYHSPDIDLIFEKSNLFPVVVAFARCPSRCRDLVKARLLQFLANTDDPEKEKRCLAVLDYICWRANALSSLKKKIEEEKEQVKKDRLEKQIKILEDYYKEVPEASRQPRGGLID